MPCLDVGIIHSIIFFTVVHNTTQTQTAQHQLPIYSDTANKENYLVLFTGFVDWSTLSFTCLLNASAILFSFVLRDNVLLPVKYKAYTSLISWTIYCFSLFGVQRQYFHVHLLIHKDMRRMQDASRPTHGGSCWWTIHHLPTPSIKISNHHSKLSIVFA